jgi:hypothetical protein
VRLRSKREIQHVHGAANCTPHPMVSVAGHEIPADDFIAPKRSRMHVDSQGEAGPSVAELEAEGTTRDEGIRPC